MFTPDTFIDAYFTQARTALSHVQPESVRTALSTMVESQEAFVKSYVAQVQRTNQAITESVKNVSNIDWNRAFVTSK